jgi:hypothetical protein
MAARERSVVVVGAGGGTLCVAFFDGTAVCMPAPTKMGNRASGGCIFTEGTRIVAEKKLSGSEKSGANSYELCECLFLRSRGGI